jgi:hypothetical protein
MRRGRSLAWAPPLSVGGDQRRPTSRSSWRSSATTSSEAIVKPLHQATTEDPTYGPLKRLAPTRPSCWSRPSTTTPKSHRRRSEAHFGLARAIDAQPPTIPEPASAVAPGSRCATSAGDPKARRRRLVGQPWVVGHRKTGCAKRVGLYRTVDEVRLGRVEAEAVGSAPASMADRLAAGTLPPH